MRNEGQDQFAEQARWDAYGEEFLKALRENPEQHVLQESPIRDRVFYAELMGLLEPLPGQKILVLGCGRGYFSVFLAKQGAEIVGIDISPNLVEAATELARINQTACDFYQASIVSLPVEDNDFDIVVGIMVLHHLSPSDLVKTLEEVHRVLKQGGTAVFFEPVENSRVFDFLQNLIPAGKRNTPYHRPSILQRKAWQRYADAKEDRNLTTRELIAVSDQLFTVIHMSPYGFVSRLERLFGRKYRPIYNRVDRWLFKTLPPLRTLSQTVLVAYRKGTL